jgi:hypothetical protein
MRLTQMLAVLNGEVPQHDYNRLSHFDPYLYWGDSIEHDEDLSQDDADAQALLEIKERMDGTAL